MFGPDWPNGGEVDIIEGANEVYTNMVSAHTSANCVLPSMGDFTGTQGASSCATDVGCNYVATDRGSYGDDFNGVGGGVYALQWTDEAIRVWHFPRHGIPQDITSKKLDPSGWGSPLALFGTSSCDINSHFANMSIVLDTVSGFSSAHLDKRC